MPMRLKQRRELTAEVADDVTKLIETIPLGMMVNADGVFVTANGNRLRTYTPVEILQVFKDIRENAHVVKQGVSILQDD